MRKKTYHLIFWPCLTIVFGVLGWLTYSMLDLEARRSEEASRAVMEDQTRLALWRMDTALASLLSRENNRAPQDYFFLTNERKKEHSPLFSESPDFVRLYFQVTPEQSLVSPQCPDEEMLKKSGLEMADKERIIKDFRMLKRTEFINGLLAKANVGSLSPRSIDKADGLVSLVEPSIVNGDSFEIPPTERTALKQEVPVPAAVVPEEISTDSFNRKVQEPEQKKESQERGFAQAVVQEQAAKDFDLRNALTKTLESTSNFNVVQEDDPFSARDEKKQSISSKMAKAKGSQEGKSEDEKKSRLAVKKQLPPSPSASPRKKIVAEQKERPAEIAAVLAEEVQDRKDVEVNDDEVGKTADQWFLDEVNSVGSGMNQGERRRPVQDKIIADAPLSLGTGASIPGKTDSVGDHLLGGLVPGGEKSDVTTESSQEESTPEVSLSESFISISPFSPYWIDNELYLLRTVKANAETYVQGIWLDGDKLRDLLLKEIRDILPNARLLPFSNGQVTPGNVSRVLAALPLLVEPGAPALHPGDDSLSTLELTLIMAWVCALAAVAGVVALLSGIVRLSERRATFVSAVTHELRTPLTTFNLYTEMLMEGLVPEAKRTSYFETLRREAARLTHMVDNVLSFSRIEKTRSKRHFEQVTVQELRDLLVRHISPRLKEAEMEVQDTVSPGAAGHTIETDVTAVEQIFYNFADNVVKYAAHPGGKVELHFSEENKRLSICFRDHGEGLPLCVRKKLFKPFSRSAEEAAGKKPGVGLGLALSREIARDLGGDLKLDSKAETGTSFLLLLPVKAKQR